MQSTEFLSKLIPGGPWQVAAISPIDGSIRVQYFESLEALAVFIKEHNGKDNLYFTLNSLMRRLNKKPSRKDIDSVMYLHADIDPIKGEPLQDEQERIRKLLTEELPAGVPEPTIINFTGGGYQAFWNSFERCILIDEE